MVLCYENGFHLSYKCFNSGLSLLGGNRVNQVFIYLGL